MKNTTGNMPARAEGVWGAQYEQLKRRVAGRLYQGFYSEFHGYGMRRDLSRPLARREAKIPLSIRPLEPGDVDILLPTDGMTTPSERQQIEWRRHFNKKVPRGGHVAIDERTGKPCFVQWLLGPADNALLAPYKSFPLLKEGEALVEQSYTIPSHRGLGIMSVATRMISDRALDFGARHVLAFLGEGGDVSLRAFRNAGFEPHMLHRRTQIGYGALVFNRFEILAKDDPRCPVAR